MVLFRTGIVTVTTLLLVSGLVLTRSQIIPSACGPSLFPLAPCGPYVQGQSSVTTQQCCQNLAQAYQNQPACLCLFLNGTALASLPINTTRALLLPQLCDVHIDSSTCSSPDSRSAPPRAPASQSPLRPSPTVSDAGPPTVTVAPRPSTARFGMGINSANRVAGIQFRKLAAISTLLAILLW